MQALPRTTECCDVLQNRCHNWSKVVFDLNIIFADLPQTPHAVLMTFYMYLYMTTLIYYYFRLMKVVKYRHVCHWNQQLCYSWNHLYFGSKNLILISSNEQMEVWITWRNGVNYSYCLWPLSSFENNSIHNSWIESNQKAVLFVDATTFKLYNCYQI